MSVAISSKVSLVALTKSIHLVALSMSVALIHELAHSFLSIIVAFAGGHRVSIRDVV